MTLRYMGMDSTPAEVHAQVSTVEACLCEGTASRRANIKRTDTGDVLPSLVEVLALAATEELIRSR